MDSEILKDHELTRDYFGERANYWIAHLKFRLKGKPDNEGWRESYRQNKITPVVKGDRIYPLYALMDLYKLISIDAELGIRILGDKKLEEFPSLDDLAQ